MLKYITSTIFLFVAAATFAQEADSIKVDAIDTLQAKGIDTVAVAKATETRVEQRVSPVRTLGQVEVIDTIATANSAISVLLFNDNTWRYILAEDFKNDPEVFNEKWDTSTPYIYYNLDVNTLPEEIPIRLVDSLKSYHYPYIGIITSRYGLRRGRPHQGMDISLKTGTPIYATFDGKVRIAKYAGDYGNLVIIRHCNGLETWHAHLSEISVSADEWVVAGQQIGLGGSTGRSSGPHLHFEVRYRGQSFDPERIIDFKTGELRREELLLKRRHFSIYSKFEQDFNEETEVAKQEEAERKAAAKPKQKPKTQYHTVRSGDTLSAIARKYGTTVNSLCKLNNIQSTSILSLGQQLRVK